MGSFDEMYRRIEEKMQKGFRCIKLKIGAIDFEKELELLAHIRRHFTPEQIELRVDANGAFTPTMLLINYSVFPSFTFTPSNSLSAPDSGKR